MSLKGVKMWKRIKPGKYFQKIENVSWTIIKKSGWWVLYMGSAKTYWGEFKNLSGAKNSVR